MSPHRQAEERSVALHAAVAHRLRERPELMEVARARVRTWLADGDRPYARAWDSLLRLPLEELCDALVDRSERGATLRQCSPFAGVVDARSRWRILRELEQAHS
jgi:hypothetical protein